MSFPQNQLWTSFWSLNEASTEQNIMQLQDVVYSNMKSQRQTKGQQLPQRLLRVNHNTAQQKHSWDRHTVGKRLLMRYCESVFSLRLYNLLLLLWLGTSWSKLLNLLLLSSSRLTSSSVGWKP